MPAYEFFQESRYFARFVFINNFSSLMPVMLLGNYCDCVQYMRLAFNAQCEDGQTLYEYVVRADGSGWQHWREQVPAWIYPKQEEKPKYSQLIIPTLDSVRYKKLFSLLHSVNKVCGRSVANAHSFRTSASSDNQATHLEWLL